ncbi:hypothetical protein [Burkholderia sp. BCC1640]|uniref:hypothetical protein n=1 Tax=Burkholderia sp. BCC1640 TaxID=2676294 RepID=UPI001588496A|nr:hypothetical protein [Burkholderia sp. BCC1640]
MATLYVQFSDSTESKIVGYFASPQDESNYPNIGNVETSDARWAAFVESLGSEGAGLPTPTPQEGSTSVS